MSCAETPDTGNLETTTVASEPQLQAAKVSTTAPASAKGTGLGEVLEVGMSDEAEEWWFRLGAAGGNLIKLCWRERGA